MTSHAAGLGAVGHRGRVRAAAQTLATDRAALAVLGAAFLVLTAITWRKWGVLEVDSGYELTVADSVAHGATPYEDVRYFYGPLGLAALAGAFEVFGTSLTVVFAFGLVQAAAILGCFYALARRWLPPLSAGLATAILMAIAFSGTARNFILPHTNSATFGLLCLLGLLLALAHRRPVAGGVLLGLAALTRPEFLAVAAAAAAGYVIGCWRDEGRAAGLRAAVRIGAPAALVGGGTLAVLAAQVGAHRLFLENLWPVDFIREAGFQTQSDWMPFTVASVIGLLARGVLYLSAACAFVLAVDRASRARGARGRALAAAGPLAAAAALSGGMLAAWSVVGVADAEREQVRSELTNLLIGMSWLPLLALGLGAWTAWALIRKRRAPLTGSWAVDLPLIVTAAALGLRAYAAFTDEASYAPYYAAPLVLLLAIAHHRLPPPRPAARAASAIVLLLVAGSLAGYAVVGLYADDTTTVHTPRGSYVGTADAAAAVPGVMAAVDRVTAPGDPILVAPAEGGVYFLTGRRPALYDVQFLPGLLDTAADEDAAVARLERRGVRAVVIGARDLTDFGSTAFGVDYVRRLGAYLDAHTVRRVAVGNQTAVTGTYAARGYIVLELR